MFCYSARDKTILEEAYNNNPKPDKQARLAIVDLVSLNEREVQVRVAESNTNKYTNTLRVDVADG
jgi:hypothetical protein